MPRGAIALGAGIELIVRPGREARTSTLQLLTRQIHDGGHGTPSASSASNRA